MPPQLLAGGRVEREHARAAEPDARDEVADLFANVPARRKFLKTVTTEWGHISEWLARAALSLPDVHFEVRRDDRPATIWPATSNPLDRIAAVVSESAAWADAWKREKIEIKQKHARVLECKKSRKL